VIMVVDLWSRHLQFQVAISRRRSGPATLHSDQGSTYAAADYRALLGKHAIRQSMSRKGDCWDNAPMESFFSALKTELIFHETYRTRKQAQQSIFEFIEVSYNWER
jgi:putative transposase